MTAYESSTTSTWPCLSRGYGPGQEKQGHTRCAVLLRRLPSRVALDSMCLHRFPFCTLQFQSFFITQACYLGRATVCRFRVRSPNIKRPMHSRGCRADSTVIHMIQALMAASIIVDSGVRAERDDIYSVTGLMYRAHVALFTGHTNSCLGLLAVRTYHV